MTHMHMTPTTAQPAPALRRLLFGATFAGCLLAAAAAGCSSNDLHGEDFDGPTVARANGTYIQNMAAASSAQEGALQEQDFQNDTLDSLGQVQLDLIVKGTAPAQPVVIHLDFPKPIDNEALTTREASATAYLVDRGIAKSDVQFVEGPNTATNTPAAAVLPLVYGGAGAATPGNNASSGGNAAGTP